MTHASAKRRQVSGEADLYKHRGTGVSDEADGQRGRCEG